MYLYVNRKLKSNIHANKNIYTYIYIYIYIYMYPSIHPSIHPSSQPSIHPCMHVYMYIYIYMYTYMYIRIYTYTYTYTYTDTYNYIYMSVYLYIYTYIHIYIYIYIRAIYCPVFRAPSRSSAGVTSLAACRALCTGKKSCKSVQLGAQGFSHLKGPGPPTGKRGSRPAGLDVCTAGSRSTRRSVSCAARRLARGPKAVRTELRDHSCRSFIESYCLCAGG